MVNRAKPRAAETLARVDQCALDAGLTVCCTEENAEWMPHAESMSLDAMRERMECLMVFGGDGSMLSAVRVLGTRHVPILGVNIGSLGFLTSVAEDDLARALACLAQGDYTTSRRTRLACTVERVGRAPWQAFALNDFLLTSPSPRVVTLELAVDGEVVTSYACDGLIVATPTGSTGHSLSASGPIVHPEAEALLITLICPHTLSSRPLVLAGDSVIDVTVRACVEGVSATVDGQVAQALAPGDRARISVAPERVELIHLPDYSYFAVLRQKLGWRGSAPVMQRGARDPSS